MTKGTDKALHPVRIAKWDNLKALLIFLMVFCHLAEDLRENYPLMSGLYFFIYLFHMPAFLFVSGLFCKRAVKTRDYDRVFSFLLIYLVTKVLIFLVERCYDAAASMLLFSENGVPWYGIVMAAFLLLTMFFQRYQPAFILVFSIALGCVGGYFRDVGKTLSINRMLVFYPYFLAGFYLDPDALARRPKRPAVRIAAAAVILCAAGLCIKYAEVLKPFTTFLKGRNSYRSLGDLKAYGGYLRLASYALAFLLIFSFTALIPARRLGLITTAGRRTLTIYMLHYLPILVLKQGLDLKNQVLSRWPGRLSILIYALISLAIVLVLAAPGLHWLMRRLITPPRRALNEDGNRM